MKKTNVRFPFFAKGKSLWVGIALIGAFFFLGVSTASAQLVPKDATPLEKMQAEYNWLQEKLAPLPPGHQYHATFAPLMAFLESMIHDMTVEGLSFHAAMHANRSLIPQPPHPVSTGNEGSAVLKRTAGRTSVAMVQ